MTTPTPIDPTVRAAVLKAECETTGQHIYVFLNMLFSSTNGGSTDMIGAQDPAQLPHVECRRCGRIWIVLDTGGHSYDEGLVNIQNKVSDHNILIPPPRPADWQDGGHGHGHTDQSHDADPTPDANKPPKDPKAK